MFTVEVHPHNKPNETAALLQEIWLLGYRSFLVEEQCGVPVDCRNLLNLPRVGSATLPRLGDARLCDGVGQASGGHALDHCDAGVRRGVRGGRRLLSARPALLLQHVRAEVAQGSGWA